MDQVAKEYYDVLNQQKFNIADLDYAVFKKHIPFLNQMATIKNSGLSVFDMSKKEHIYNSLNFSNLFGYTIANNELISSEYYDSRIHPEDYKSLFQNGVSLLKYYLNLPVKNRKDYKSQSEYRVLNANNQYVRIIEQQQVLELDKNGNIWLVLSILDISPNQNNKNGIISQLVNVKTGDSKIIKQKQKKLQEEIKLSKREKEILSFVKKGLLSKEISDNLSISIHTVNTHRQNILKKLGVQNSIEAIECSSKFKLP